MKVILKETEKTILAVDILFYLAYALCGCILIIFPQIEVFGPIKYTSSIFYFLGLFSLVAYFINRRKNNYEFLLLGLSNILVGTFIYVYSYYDNTGFILGNAILIYSLANVLNKGWHSYNLSKRNDINMFPKLGITILLSLLGFLVITNLYKSMTMQTLILGYYFLVFGIISLIEPIMLIVMKNKKLNKYLNSLLAPDIKTEVRTVKEVKPKKLVKEIKKK